MLNRKSGVAKGVSSSAQEKVEFAKKRDMKSILSQTENTLLTQFKRSIKK